MTAPGVVASIAGSRLKRAAEIGLGESCYVILYAQFDQCVAECGQSLAELRIKLTVCFKFHRMSIKTSERSEKDLPAHAQPIAYLNDLRYLLQLCTKASLRESSLQRCGF